MQLSTLLFTIKKSIGKDTKIESHKKVIVDAADHKSTYIHEIEPAMMWEKMILAGRLKYYTCCRTVQGSR